MAMTFLRLLFAATMVAGLAYAEPIAWNFRGNVVGCPSTPQVAALVPCDTPSPPLHGYLRFDNATWPTVPAYGYAAEFSLPTGAFHAEIQDLVLDGINISAHIGPNRDELVFEGDVTSANIPGVSGQWVIFIDTYRDGYFGINRLPANPPVTDPDTYFWVDEAMAIWLGVPQGSDYVSDEISTDTQFGLWRAFPADIPEPTPLALYFGLGVILISMRRFFGSLAVATRKLVAPRPLTVSRFAATP